MRRRRQLFGAQHAVAIAILIIEHGECGGEKFVAANLAIVIVFGFGSARDQDFAVWLYYPAMIFALQSAAWYVAWTLKKKGWMLAASIGGWATAVALGLLVREPLAYLLVATAALFLLFAGPGWIITREALKARPAAGRNGREKA